MDVFAKLIVDILKGGFAKERRLRFLRSAAKLSKGDAGAGYGSSDKTGF